MRTETIEVDDRFGAEYKGKYIFQEISWAKRSRIIQKHTKYHPLTGNVLRSDYIAIQAEMIFAALKEQPEHRPVSIEKLLSEDNGIPVGLGEIFSKTVNELCGLSVDQMRFLSEPSEEKSRTQASRSSASAGSSGGHHASSRSSQRGLSRSSS